MILKNMFCVINLESHFWPLNSFLRQILFFVSFLSRICSKVASCEFQLSSSNKPLSIFKGELFLRILIILPRELFSFAHTKLLKLCSFHDNETRYLQRVKKCLGFGVLSMPLNDSRTFLHTFKSFQKQWNANFEHFWHGLQEKLQFWGFQTEKLPFNRQKKAKRVNKKQTWPKRIKS